MKVTEEEIAGIIFNSSDPELNDMILQAKEYNYDVQLLVTRIMADINGHFSDRLEQLSGDQRKEFIQNRIHSELNYYAHWYKKK